MKKVLKTVKNTSEGALLVRNSDGVKKEVASNGTFVTYKRKELMRLYKSYFTITSDEDGEVYKITAISESVVSIVDKKNKEVISMKVETTKVDDTDVSTFYLWIGDSRKADDDADIIALVEEMITSVVAGDNVVSKEDADELVAEYNTLS